MRIIAGRFRRRKLWTNPGLVTRPLTDRVKEILFERLGGELPPWRVADVFAGTGTLGLEALSRGARTAVFVEQDRKAFELLRRNVETLGVEADTLCWNTDALRSSFRPHGVDDLLPYDLIFFDPPYALVADLRPGRPLFRSLERLARPGIAAPGALLVLRVPERAEFVCPDVWEPSRHWELSTMEVVVHRLRRERTESSDDRDARSTAATEQD